MKMTCQQMLGCPASLYFNKSCVHKLNRNCWDSDKGCALRKCDQNCEKCLGQVAVNKEPKIA